MTVSAGRRNPLMCLHTAEISTKAQARELLSRDQVPLASDAGCVVKTGVALRHEPLPHAVLSGR